MDLQDRLNWQQACTVLGCKKSTLYKLVDDGAIGAYGAGARFRWYSRAECLAHVRKKLTNNSK